MNILHIIDIKDKNCNGVATAVLSYLKHQSKYANVSLYDLNNVFSDISEYNVISYNEFNTINSFNNKFKPDIVVFHEIYKPKYIKLYKECLKSKIPYVIVPHGSLVYKEQRRKFIKKFLGNTLLFNKYVSSANAVQFLNELERNNSHFKYKKSFISGNGIEFTDAKYMPPQTFELIYIGRYSIYTKGLDLLIEVCSELKEWFTKNNVKINIYGKSDELEVIKLKSLVEQNGISDFFIINNPIYGEEKLKKMCNSSVFIQLSRHEAQPMTIIEALSLGLPCIATYNTSFGNYLNNKQCGIGVNFDKEEVKKAIIDLYNDREKLSKLSINAKENTKKDFNWDIIEKKLMKEYEDIINGI